MADKKSGAGRGAAGSETSEKKRLDEVVVTLGLADDLRMARGLVMAGKIVVDDQRIDKPGYLVAPGQVVRRKQAGRRNAGTYVSRGGEKLANALSDLNLKDAIVGQRVLDLGASTGGFTDVCLSLGADAVIAVDVGTNQLAYALREDPRVTVREKTDIRDIGYIDPPPSFVVADISFNSMARLAPFIIRAAPRVGTRFVLLVKPQFELPREQVPDGGIVTDPELHAAALDAVWRAFDQYPITNKTTVPARPLGRAGNQEFFIFFQLSESYAE